MILGSEHYVKNPEKVKRHGVARRFTPRQNANRQQKKFTDSRKLQF